MKLKRILSILLVTALIFTSAGCVQLDTNGNPIPTATPAPIKTESELFEDYLMDSFREIAGNDMFNCRFMMKNPTTYGITDISPTVGEIDFEDIDNATERWQEEYDRLLAFNRANLTEEQQLIYDIIKHDMKSTENVLGLEYLSEICSPLLGVQSQFPSLLSEYELYTVADAFDYIKILQSIPDYFEDVLEYQRKKSEKGFFMSNDMADRVIESCRNTIKDGEKSDLITGFPKRIEELPEITEAQKKELIDLNKKAVTDYVFSAYENFIKGIEKLRGTGKNSGGLCGFEGGKTYYEYLVCQNTGSDRSIATISHMMDETLDRMMAAILYTIKSDEGAFDRFLDAKVDYGSPEDIMKLLQKKTQKDFPKVNELVYDIKSVAPELEEHTSPAFFIIPQIDDPFNNSIYINNKYVKDDPIYLFTTLAHEGYPGHMYQNCYFNATKPHPIRRLLPSKGYSEGWASYVENLAYEMTDIEDVDVVVLLQSFNVRSLMLSGRIDIGVNYEGWDKARLKEYLAQYGFEDDEVVTEMFNAVVDDPANYLAYAVGFMEMQKLKNDTVDTLGEDFDAMAFHKVILDIGPAPFSFVQKAVDDYVFNVKKERHAAEIENDTKQSDKAA